VTPTANGERNVVGIVEVLLDDLHVHRLRQIYNCVTNRLGHENTRLNLGVRSRTRKVAVEVERSELPAAIRPTVEIALVPNARGKTATFAKAVALG
jgi:hypothetical protein